MPLPPLPPICPQVISLCEKPRDPPLQFIVADTPGQVGGRFIQWLALWPSTAASQSPLLPPLLPCSVAACPEARSLRCGSIALKVQQLLQIGDAFLP